MCSFPCPRFNVCRCTWAAMDFGVLRSKPSSNNDGFDTFRLSVMFVINVDFRQSTSLLGTGGWQDAARIILFHRICSNCIMFWATCKQRIYTIMIWESSTKCHRCQCRLHISTFLYTIHGMECSSTHFRWIGSFICNLAATSILMWCVSAVSITLSYISTIIKRHISLWFQQHTHTHTQSGKIENWYKLRRAYCFEILQCYKMW